MWFCALHKAQGHLRPPPFPWHAYAYVVQNALLRPLGKECHVKEEPYLQTLEGCDVPAFKGRLHPLRMLRVCEELPCTETQQPSSFHCGA